MLRDVDPKDYPKLRYQYDPEVRRKQVNRMRVRRGSPELREMPYQSLSFGEVCDRLRIERKTFNRYQQMGIIPLPTYPSTTRRYWRHQVALLKKLFDNMRTHGWPKVTPKFDGTAYWTRALRELEEAWTREGPVHVRWRGDYRGSRRSLLDESDRN